VQTHPPELADASVRTRLPPETDTFAVAHVVLPQPPPLIVVHLVASRLFPLNSSSKASVHVPGMFP
jgi:hypothetical protein